MKALSIRVLFQRIPLVKKSNLIVDQIPDPKKLPDEKAHDVFSTSNVSWPLISHVQLTC